MNKIKRKASLEFKIVAFQIFPMAFGLIYPAISPVSLTSKKLLLFGLLWFLTYFVSVILVECFQKEQKPHLLTNDKSSNE